MVKSYNGEIPELDIIKDQIKPTLATLGPLIYVEVPHGDYVGVVHLRAHHQIFIDEGLPQVVLLIHVPDLLFAFFHLDHNQLGAGL
jgi:hypothetical protein